MMLETKILWFFSLFIFSKIRDIPLPNCKIHGKNLKQKIKKVCTPWLGSLFHHSENTSFRYIWRKNTSSQWLISFRKIQRCKLFLQVKGNFNKIKRFRESFSICSKPTTPGLACASCFCSWSSGLTLWRYTFNNVQLRTRRPTNKRKMRIICT